MGALTEAFLYRQLKEIFGAEHLDLAYYTPQKSEYTYIPIMDEATVIGWVGIQNSRLTDETKRLIPLLCEPHPLLHTLEKEALFWQKASTQSMAEWHKEWVELAYPAERSFGLIYITVKQKKQEQWNTDMYEQCRELIEGVMEEKSFLLPITQGRFVWIVPAYASEKQGILELCKGLVDTLAAELMLQTHFFIDEPVQMPFELRNYLQRQLKVVQVCEHVTRKSVHFMHDLLHLHLLKQAPREDREQYAQQVLGATSDDAELLETIRVYFQENLNASETAKKLFIHRNSMQYRLDKFFEKTGYDLKRFEHAVIVSIALQVLGMLNKE